MLGSAPENASSAKARRLVEMTAAYRPLEGVPDEFIGADGRPRGHWLEFFDKMAGLGADDIGRRFEAIERNIREQGVSYRAYGETVDRMWPLSHMPLLISEKDWAVIEAGVTQRAEVFEGLLSDLYGRGQLVSDGLMPAAAVTGSADFLHPMIGVTPRGGRYLNLYAADLGRGPDGQWWVLNDRAQAPSGLGYALENRLNLSRAFQSIYREMNVRRLAPFFQHFRAGLAAIASRSDPRICLHTPGPYSETYYEQAYLARYLGFVLVEGADLVARDGLAHVRTIAGLKRADVIWRRIDADFADPLELKGGSRLGVPGLVEAIRQGNVSVANALGAGVAETPALLGFMPTLSRRLLGEKLILPTIATWWCGQEAEREYVLERLQDMAVAPAFGASTTRTFLGRSVVAGELSQQQREKLAASIRERGADYIAQEVVRLSTTPVWVANRLEPRPFVLRVYAALGPDGKYQVMPGGFCRISDRLDSRAVAMGQGVQTSDVWIVANRPVEMTTLLPQSDAVAIRRIMGNLPSRAADNLFWLGRYLERAEATLRLIRCLARRTIENEDMSPEGAATTQRLRKLLTDWGAVPAKPVAPLTPVGFLNAALFNVDEFGSAVSLARDSQRTASVIRERLSGDTWRIIVELCKQLEAGRGPLDEPEILERADIALEEIASISGLAQENMNRVAGWRFLEIGRRLERAVNTCRFIRQFGMEQARATDFDVLLDLIDSQITYRSRYLVGVAPYPVRDMALLDPYNPRSVAFQTERLTEHIATLPLLRQDGMLEPPNRIAIELNADLATKVASCITAEFVLSVERRLMGLADAVATRYFLQGANAAQAEKQVGLA
ncbi:MAG: circularly permuted type 2 ATP-grasp protein [Rhodoblastus sp.]|uniref:circularly permuted type 2 ATP-grasp protein n=1 Tax=Rhodoblastus sp. TaxID=1962975 RepID=UPI003F946854